MLSQQEGKNARILFFHNIGFFRTLSRVKADIYGISIKKTILWIFYMYRNIHNSIKKKNKKQIKISHNQPFRNKEIPPFLICLN